MRTDTSVSLNCSVRGRSHTFHSLQTTDRRTQKTAPCLRWAEPLQPLADVLRAGEQKRFRFAEKLFLVLFIDSKHSW